MLIDEVFAFSPVASFQSVGDGAVVLLADSGQLFSCNDTSEAFLRKVDGKRKLSEIIDLLAEEYEVSRDVLSADLDGTGSKSDARRHHRQRQEMTVSARPASFLTTFRFRLDLWLRRGRCLGGWLENPSSRYSPWRRRTAVSTTPGFLWSIFPSGFARSVRHPLADARPALPARGAARLRIPAQVRILARTAFRGRSCIRLVGSDIRPLLGLPGRQAGRRRPAGRPGHHLRSPLATGTPRRQGIELIIRNFDLMGPVLRVEADEERLIRPFRGPAAWA